VVASDPVVVLVALSWFEANIPTMQLPLKNVVKMRIGS